MAKLHDSSPPAQASGGGWLYALLLFLETAGAVLLFMEGLPIYRKTLAELGRQLLASRTGMLRINYSHRDQWLKAMDWGNHHLGTTRMSNDPKLGVVNADSQVHGVSNLYVAGSSVFPTYGSSNPTLNLIALTLRLGDHLRKVMA